MEKKEDLTMDVLKKIGQVSLKVLKVLGRILGVLFVVYFWNLDEKLMAWLYKKINILFDRKSADIQF